MRKRPLSRVFAFSVLASCCFAACQHAPPKTYGGPATAESLGAPPPPLPGHNLLYNESFNEGTRALPWSGEFSIPAEGRTVVQNGELCAEVKNRGVARWDVQLKQQHIHLQKGHTYQVQFKLHSTQPTKVYLKLGDAGPPYKEFWKLLFMADSKPQIYSGTFTMTSPDDPSVELAFHLGGQLSRLTPVPFTVCIDDARLDDPQYVQTPEAVPPAVPNVLVNQIGYFPALAKLAVVKNPNAVPWELKNPAGQTVANGTTIPFGPDGASGDQVSIIDFTSFSTPGKAYTLRVGNDVSHPFEIGDGLYRKLKYDALAFFYQQRSGIPIEMPYAGGLQWAHVAGHVGVKPNYGDIAVPCATGSSCSYTLDVSGGWYDAGDHGKYVVNAGISVWTLLDFWERTKAVGTSADDFADGKMNIPESKNGVPDLLDEARWELEFELKMQVPAAEKLGGMVHHKVHDLKWTQLSTGPHEDPMPRYLQPPTTAATLNLAANAAQAARVWKKLDKAFSEKCLAAGERAWVAARANPAILAPHRGEGGGAYDDDKVEDDFYWAAAELYITTGKSEYKDFVTKSSYFKKVTADWDDNPGMKTSMTWGDTAALGSISLALVPNGLPKADIDDIKKKIVVRGDELLDIVGKQGYRLPFSLPAKGYPWGSSSFVLTNALMLALASDFSHDGRYINGVAAAMDYILGRNPIDQSYVTGYGSRPLENPYHRFWCHQANDKYPSPPPGVLSGGPNSDLNDPYVQASGLVPCAAQKCFIDNGEAWSVNEVTINWNAPLAWVAAWLDEKTSGKRPTPAKGSPTTHAKLKK